MKCLRTSASVAGTSNRRAALGAAAVASVILAGCSGLGGGSSLTCKLPEGARCDSVSNTYTESTRGELPGQRQRYGSDHGAGIDAPEGATPVPAPSGVSRRTSDHVVRYTDARMTHANMPLRSPARIVRVWIKPWEDSDGDLHDQTFVYLSVNDGHWLLDHKQREVRDAYAPIRAPARAEAGVMPAADGDLRTAAPGPALPAASKLPSQILDAVQRAKSVPANVPSSNTSGSPPSPVEGGRSGG